MSVPWLTQLQADRRLIASRLALRQDRAAALLAAAPRIADSRHALELDARRTSGVVRRWQRDRVHRLQQGGQPRGEGRSSRAIRTLDLATGVVTERARVEGGSHYRLVGWERAENTVAATHAPEREPATTYLAISPTGRRTWTLDGPHGENQSGRNSRDWLACAATATRRRTPPSGSGRWTTSVRADQRFGPGISLGLVAGDPAPRRWGFSFGRVTALKERTTTNCDRPPRPPDGLHPRRRYGLEGVLPRRWWRSDHPSGHVSRDRGGGRRRPRLGIRGAAAGAETQNAPFDNSQPVASIRMP